LKEHLREADCDVERGVDIPNSDKKCYDHTQYDLGSSEISGNYGVCGGQGGDPESTSLVILDIDGYDEDADEESLKALQTILPVSLLIHSPHTNDGSGGHLYLAVKGGVSEELNDRFGVTNPSPTWGEVMVRGEYGVGPGSQLDGCSKEWCDECAKPDGGFYQIAVDRPIATIPVNDLVEVIEADPNYGNEPDGADRSPSDKKRTTARKREEVDLDSEDCHDPPEGFNYEQRVNMIRNCEYGPLVRALEEGRYRDTPHGDDRSKAEIDLLQKIGWAFAGNKAAILRFLRETAKRHPRCSNGQPRKWTENDHHFRDILATAMNRDGPEDMYRPDYGCDPQTSEASSQSLVWGSTPENASDARSEARSFSKAGKTRRDGVGEEAFVECYCALVDMGVARVAELAERLSCSKRQVNRMMDAAIEDSIVATVPGEDARKTFYIPVDFMECDEWEARLAEIGLSVDEVIGIFADLSSRGNDTHETDSDSEHSSDPGSGANWINSTLENETRHRSDIHDIRCLVVDGCGGGRGMGAWSDGGDGSYVRSSMRDVWGWSRGPPPPPRTVDA
jgi:hypothetical protein